jgi:hypothetical protein
MGICRATFLSKFSQKSSFCNFNLGTRRSLLKVVVTLQLICVICMQTFLKNFLGRSSRPHAGKGLIHPSPDPTPPFALPCHFQIHSGASVIPRHVCEKSELRWVWGTLKWNSRTRSYDTELFLNWSFEVLFERLPTKKWYILLLLFCAVRQYDRQTTRPFA